MARKKYTKEEEEAFYDGFTPLEINHDVVEDPPYKHYEVYLHRTPDNKRGWLSYRKLSRPNSSYTLSVRVMAKDGQQAKTKAITWINKIVNEPDKTKYAHEFGNLRSINWKCADWCHISKFPELQFIVNYFR